MFVKDYMTRHPLMVEPTIHVVEAQRYMGENRVRHLPVVGSGKRLVGLVTRERLLVDPGRLGSLDVWDIARTLTGLTVKDVMIKDADVITTGQDVTIEEAARVMVRHNIGCLPVLEEGIVVGIITDRDLLAQLSEMLAVNWPVPGVRAAVRMPNVPGELAKLVAAVSAQGWGIAACGGSLYPRDTSKWDAVIKLSGVDVETATAVLAQVEGHEIVDVRSE